MLLHPDYGWRTLTFLGLVCLIVFLPVWLISTCYYHPYELSFCPNNTPDNITHYRQARDLTAVDTTSLTDKMLLLQFKYGYAQKSGYDQCWVCSKLHPGTMRIPLMAAPVNITPFLNGTPAVNIQKVSDVEGRKEIAFPIIAYVYSPDWCFRVGNSSNRNLEMCHRSVMNMSGLDPDTLNHVWNVTKEVNHTIWTMNNPNNPLSRSTLPLLGLLSTVGWRDDVAARKGQAPFTLSNSLFICCGKMCYPWIPMKERGWCYLASLIPVLDIIGSGDPRHVLQASIHPKYPLKHVDKRELFSNQDMAWSWFPSWTGWGIELMRRLNNYSIILDEILNKTSDDIILLNREQRALRKQVMLHELAIESMGAALTGLCEVTEDYECCTWIHNTSMEVPDYYEVIEEHRKEVAGLQAEARKIVNDGWNPFKGLGTFGNVFGSIFSWFKEVGMLILMCLLLFLFVYMIIKLGLCIYKKTTQDNGIYWGQDLY